MLNVFEISRMTNHNGPGIRTLVHFKGCPLRCKWCSTPESQSAEPELLYKSVKCISCGACLRACPQQAIAPDPQGPGRMAVDRTRCRRCFSCVDACCAGALCRSGRPWTVDALEEEIRRDEVFFRTSGGGVTFSGGEPLMCVDGEMVELYRRIHCAGITIAVDTTGYTRWENIEKVLPFVSYFLWDLKVMDPVRHREYTGVDNALILENLRKVEERAGAAGTRVCIRCVQIPGYTDDDENLVETCRFLKGMQCVEELGLINFHHLGLKRYQASGHPYLLEDLEPLPMEELRRKMELVRGLGIPCRISF